MSTETLFFCTLFDSNYAAYGLSMYESLAKRCRDFHLYIFALCDNSCQLLKTRAYAHVTVVSLSEFEDEALLRIKPTRTRAEYCWTCASSAIWYCLIKLGLPHCTYCDADIYFYADPRILIGEMGGSSVLITEHRYFPRYDQTKTSGKYCVQFMTFKNDERGVKVLKWWRNACLEWCYNRFENGKFGDQKYLDDWPSRFDGIHVLQHIGGGVAPWNLQRYHFKKDGDCITLSERSKGPNAADTLVVFFHFHTVKIAENGKINDDYDQNYVCKRRERLLFYYPYFKTLRGVSQALHDLCPSVRVIDYTLVSLRRIGLRVRAVRKWIITIRLSRRHREVRFLGLWFIAPSDGSFK